MQTSTLFVVILAALTSLVLMSASAKVLAKRETGPVEGGQYQMMPRKRPFCNAFTGCGRKRSSFGNVKDSGSSPTSDSADALMRLSQRIVAEARLWELLQQKLYSKESLYEPFPEE